MTHEDAFKRLRRFVIGFCVLLTLMVAIPAVSMTLFRQTVLVTVTEIGAARSCKSTEARRSYRWLNPRFRSEVPSIGLIYCGLIMTDHGSFKLPETTWLSVFEPSREELYDTLVEGCMFEITVRGAGPDLQLGNARSNRNRILAKAQRVGDCTAARVGEAT